MIWGRASHFADGKKLANLKDQHFPVGAFQQFKLCGKQSWYVMAGFYCKVQILKNNPPLTLGFLDIWAPSIVLHCFALFSNAFEIFLKGFLWVPIRSSCWTCGMVVNLGQPWCCCFAGFQLSFCRDHKIGTPQGFSCYSRGAPNNVSSVEHIHSGFYCKIVIFGICMNLSLLTRYFPSKFTKWLSMAVSCSFLLDPARSFWNLLESIRSSR